MQGVHPLLPPLTRLLVLTDMSRLSGDALQRRLARCHSRMRAHAARRRVRASCDMTTVAHGVYILALLCNRGLEAVPCIGLHSLWLTVCAVNSDNEDGATLSFAPWMQSPRTSPCKEA